MSRIKSCFISRWKDGYLMQVDYSQLEVIGLAYLSQDRQLYEDILNGLDMHCINASFLYGEDYDFIKRMVDSGDEEWIAKRKKAKGPGFLIQYGGGATLMSKNTGLPLEDCKQFIINYYERYSGVGDWQDTVAEQVQASRTASSKRTESFKPAGRGVFKSITGREYVFYEYDAPEFLRTAKKYTSFSPTQMKNYPVQGFATGDVVPLMLGVLYRKMMAHNDYKDTDKVCMINTVHDSIMFDVREKYLTDFSTWVKIILEDTEKYLNKALNLKFDLPLKVDVEYGKTWADMTNITNFKGK